MNVQYLPAINATLNGIATLFLFLGWWAIKRNRSFSAHLGLMAAALICSSLFLACYLYYHYNAGAMTPFQGQGLVRAVYFFILFTHIPLAALMVPFILAALYFALRKQYTRHTMITRYLWPVWMYVSITGVVIYLMLYQIY